MIHCRLISTRALSASAAIDTCESIIFGMRRLLRLPIARAAAACAMSSTVATTIGRADGRVDDDVAPIKEHAARPYDVLVIGGGVVGLSTARECASRGAKTLLIEREDAWAAGASSGNSGIGCTGYDAPVGSLERKLLRRSIQRHPELMRSFGLSYNHVRKCGSLVVAWTEDQLAKLPAVLDENREAGDAEASILSQAELQAYEPALSQLALGAVLCPREAVVEPWLVAQGYAESARLHGADMLLSTEATGAVYNRHSGVWEVSVRHSNASQSGRSPPGVLLVPATGGSLASPAPSPPSALIEARVVINCAGLYGDVVESWAVPSSSCLTPAPTVGTSPGITSITSAPAGTALGATPGASPGATPGVQSAHMSDDSAQVGADAPFHLEPRKGQFVVLQPVQGSPPLESVIELVATQFTKGVIIWQTVYGNVVIGPTAEPQVSREDRSTDAATVRMLLEHGRRCVPHLVDATVLGTYAGLRPATEHRDYQIRVTPCPRAHDSSQDAGPDLPNMDLPGWITVAGIRSTGLTCAPGIGEYVAELWEGLRTGTPPTHASDSSPLIDCYGNLATEATPPPDGCPVGVTTAAHHPAALQVHTAAHSRMQAKRTEALPTLSVLAHEYRKRGDGCVTLYGVPRRVTHPIASFGMETAFSNADSRHTE